jgi:hypothetical protein
VVAFSGASGRPTIDGDTESVKRTDNRTPNVYATGLAWPRSGIVRWAGVIERGDLVGITGARSLNPAMIRSSVLLPQLERPTIETKERRVTADNARPLSPRPQPPWAISRMPAPSV